MRLKLICGALIAAAVMWSGAVGLAVAASSPTLKIAAASSITTSSAVISATINPNGSKTTYSFSYGPTSALGTNSPIKSVGAGTKAEAVSYALTGLQSGTTYYFDLVAQSSGGSSTTKTVTFNTAGPAPAQAQTGAAQVLNSYSVTLTGVVNTENASTQYYFEYGTAPGVYTLQTIPITLTPSTTPTPVSLTVSNLSRSTTFHYALVATHGGINYGAGADMSFETFPNPVPAPAVTQVTSPKTEKGGPYVFTTTGQIDNKTTTPDALACAGGTVTVAFYYGKHRVIRQLASLTPTCGFSATTTFKDLPIKHKKSEQLLVYVRFDGSGYLKAVSLKPQTVTLS